MSFGLPRGVLERDNQRPFIDLAHSKNAPHTTVEVNILGFESRKATYHIKSQGDTQTYDQVIVGYLNRKKMWVVVKRILDFTMHKLKYEIKKENKNQFLPCYL